MSTKLTFDKEEHYYIDCLDRLCTEGLFFLKDDPYSTCQPPRHFETFVDYFNEFLTHETNRVSREYLQSYIKNNKGNKQIPINRKFDFEIKLPNLILLTYFWKKNTKDVKDVNKYTRNNILKLIYHIVNDGRFFGNPPKEIMVYVYDEQSLKILFGDKTFPDGTRVIDCVDEIIDHEGTFIQIADSYNENLPLLTFVPIIYQL